MARSLTKNVGQIVNKSELCSLFGVSPPSVDGWVRNGCPVVEKGSQGRHSQFNTADVAKWLRDRAREEGSGTKTADEAELRRRKLAAEAERSELELAKVKGEVAPVAEFERIWAMKDAAVRTNMRNVPRRAVLQLLGCTDETEFTSKLLAEIDLALVTAAETEIDPVDDEETGEDE